MTVFHNDKNDHSLRDIQPPKNTTSESGKKCPISGEWETQGTMSTVVYVSKGELMPQYCGKNVKWTLIRNG